jgi:hypothetical protein
LLRRLLRLAVRAHEERQRRVNRSTHRPQTVQRGGVA